MGDFEELRELSVRAGARVTLVRRRNDGRLMIRKELALAGGTEPEWSHPWFASPSNGLVPVLDWGRLPEGRGWLAMPCADGMDGASAAGDPIAYTPASLQLRMREEDPWALPDVERLACSIAATLRALHERGLTHRDVKPSNILFFEGRARLADLDLVGPSGHVPEHYGTHGYMPMLGNGDQAGDLFAVGRTLYELWTGNDRFEFPSLPPELIRSEAWNQRCVAFNDLLDRLCPTDPRRQVIRTAADLQEALDRLDQGPEPRRKQLVAGLLLGGIMIGSTIAKWDGEKAPQLPDTPEAGQVVPVPSFKEHWPLELMVKPDEITEPIAQRRQNETNLPGGVWQDWPTGQPAASGE